MEKKDLDNRFKYHLANGKLWANASIVRNEKESE